MEQRVSLITLGVRDLARARAFYDALGWRAGGPQAEGVVFYQAGGIVLSLYGRDELAADAGLDPAEPGWGGITLAYNTRQREEVDAVLDTAAAAGGRILKPGGPACWGGYIGFFADPEGHVWEVAWNPGFTLEADGSLRLPD